MTALKGLQQKIRKLELDRSQAKVNLDQLSSEAKRYQKKLEQEREDATPKSCPATPGIKDNI